MRTHQAIQEELNKHILHCDHAWNQARFTCKAQQSVLIDARFETESQVLQDKAELEERIKLEPHDERLKSQLRMYEWVLQTPRRKKTVEARLE